MDEDSDEDDEIEVQPNPFVLDEFIRDGTLYSRDNKLDEDFNFLLAFVPALFKTIKDESEMLLCEHWLDRLIGFPAHKTYEKRERNIYITNLLLNIGKGELLDPFDKDPPIKLLPGIQVFGGRLEPDICYRDVNLEAEDFAEYSQESRTFFAAKALPNGNGAFGYLAVSLGGGDAVWLDCQGNDVDPSKMRRKKSCGSESKENDQIYEKLENVISKRSPQKDRSELLPYYYGLMQRIREIANSVESGCEIYDPMIEKMVEDLQLDIMAEGKIDASEISHTNKRSWLCALEKKIEKLMEAAEERELALSQLEKVLVEHEKDKITFLDVSSAIRHPKMDPILTEAVRDRPSEHNVVRLKNNYPEDIVTAFLKLLETEKMIAVNQERMEYDQFVMHMRAEVLNEARYGLQRYNLRCHMICHLCKNRVAKWQGRKK
ncbi:unnamed protein product [Nezara viridula]|uniref:DUF4485 domain-containing protein n=1 Tax=Nezara viridula TaxID=85310 RepID=A0A9P0MNY6_NEZVI|nr:unnamed protein product [Nezara viridula]